ncbi:TetR/AcrR family transcriptional regulator [Jeotgalibacillus proteolyticus]|uniref:TetR/AcrR family transcriptional regulator n=1 Tax=Jeotgalibacillus proteolyticus TaxID=2082395 RepID=A0A2S5GDH5_9BACL|nr:TetR/AcrR family transcriptional regulator [Jeotgalibacillus proteolyticus]PPA71046.1 TetR/AcrR family transcriptional regulator [Jeotgalibacillus proteolyticus]
MPKITFHNLSQEKQHKLMTAIQNEFSRVPLQLASISNIVKEAKVPRGSFYQYFDDKEDAYYYLLSTYILELNEQFIYSLKKHEGDLFEAIIDVFQYTIEDDDHFQLMKNAFLNLSYKVENKFSGIFQGHSRKSENMKTISQYINLELLNIKSEKDFEYIVQILKAVTFRNFVEKFAKNLSNAEALLIFRKELELLKNGLARS